MELRLLWVAGNVCALSMLCMGATEEGKVPIGMPLISQLASSNQGHG